MLFRGNPGQTTGHTMQNSCTGNARFLAASRLVVSPFHDIFFTLQAPSEIAQVVTKSIPPAELADFLGNDELCLDTNRCEFACISQGFTVHRIHDRLSLNFSETYFGDCPCPRMAGEILYDTYPPFPVRFPSRFLYPIIDKNSNKIHEDEPRSHRSMFCLFELRDLKFSHFILYIIRLGCVMRVHLHNITHQFAPISCCWQGERSNLAADFYGMHSYNDAQVGMLEFLF